MRNVVIEIATGRVLMSGYCDFSGGSTYDPAVHAQIENDTHSFAPGERVDDDDNEIFWYWDGSSFTHTAP